MSLSAVCPAKLSWDLGLITHPKDWRRLGSNSRPLGYKASSFTTTPRRLLAGVGLCANAFTDCGLRVYEFTALLDLFLAKHNVEYSMSIPLRDKGCTPILVRLLLQINRIKSCGKTKIDTCFVCLG